MKTIPKTIAIMMLYSCLLSGCGITPAAEQSHVYSFRGENEFFTISNGVIVLSDTKDIFYGGNLEETQGKYRCIYSPMIKTEFCCAIV